MSVREGGVIHVPYSIPPRFTGNVEDWIKAAQIFMGEQYRLIQRLAGGGLRWQNLRSQLISGTTTNAAADGATDISHNLGKVPEFYFYMIEMAGPYTGDPPEDPIIYHTAADKAAWTATLLRLRCNVASVKIDVWLI